ncbi:MAG: dihydrodipicolinate reductase [Uliginosibacterium sp.]|nr:dihydrodipicolinate reductase [Uliginosibacterium sp.]
MHSESSAPGSGANHAVIVVGTGKLAQELLRELPGLQDAAVLPWAGAGAHPPGAVFVHAGSGRSLAEVAAHCRATGDVLIELATGSVLEQDEPAFPLVICPNTNILMLKFMAMLGAHGHRFRHESRQIVESHQAGKTSVAGTAVTLAESLGLASADIVSVRDPQVQQAELGIPAEHLARHAYHRIEIADTVGRIVLETRVLGEAPYAAGVAQILAAVRTHPLEHRRYSVMEFVERGWV